MFLSSPASQSSPTQRPPRTTRPQPLRAFFDSLTGEQNLEKQGGLQACSMAFYEERDLGKDVHSWIHVADDPKTPVTSHFG